jgi:hypothetical protein
MQARVLSLKYEAAVPKSFCPNEILRREFLNWWDREHGGRETDQLQ